MPRQELDDVWQELRGVWKIVSRTSRVRIDTAQLVVELKSKVSAFEKRSITNDLKTLESMTSQFEKDLLAKDLRYITTLLRKLIRFLTKEK